MGRNPYRRPSRGGGGDKGARKYTVAKDDWTKNEQESRGVTSKKLGTEKPESRRDRTLQEPEGGRNPKRKDPSEA